MRYDVGPLPDDALVAAARFHAEVLPGLLEALSAGPDHLTLIFAPADHTHEDWRRALVATLARERAPVRVNAIAGHDPGAMSVTAEFVASAPGLTGQYLVVEQDTGLSRA